MGLTLTYILGFVNGSTPLTIDPERSRRVNPVNECMRRVILAAGYSY